MYVWEPHIRERVRDAYTPTLVSGAGAEGRAEAHEAPRARDEVQGVTAEPLKWTLNKQKFVLPAAGPKEAVSGHLLSWARPLFQVLQVAGLFTSTIMTKGGADASLELTAKNAFSSKQSAYHRRTS